MTNLLTKPFLIFALILSFWGNGQEYNFDYKCISESKKIKPELTQSFSNSFLLLGSSNSNSYGFQNNNGDINIIDWDSLKNIKTRKIDVNKTQLVAVSDIKTDYNEFEIKKVTVSKIDELTYLVKTFRTERTKKSNLEVLFTLKKSTFPLVRIRFMDLSYPIHQNVYDALLNELHSLNYQIESANVDYRNGYQFEYKWTSCEKTNLKLNFTNAK